jgi:hypothetical protein
VNHETRIGLAIVTGLGVLIFTIMVVSSLFAPPKMESLDVSAVLTGNPAPAERFGTNTVNITGYYAEIKGDCTGDTGGADPAVSWLQAECPVRVLLPSQPSENVTQAELERDGLRLSATTGVPFPPRARPQGPNLQLDQLIFTGHFNDAAAADCQPEREERCRNTFVVDGYDNILGR